MLSLHTKLLRKAKANLHGSTFKEISQECFMLRNMIFSAQYLYSKVFRISFLSKVARSFLFHLWGGADKSLAWPTSWCRRRESIVSLERGVCSCAELQVFSCYRGWKEACQAMCAISTKQRHELSSSFFSYNARHQRKFKPFWQKH
jgi:hypothetical protein